MRKTIIPEFSSSFCAAAGAGAVTGYDGYQCVCDMGTLGVVGKTDAEEEKAYVIRGDKKVDILQPHLTLELKRGDHLVTLSGGGAGVGKPENRDPEAVRSDVRNELVSVEMARKVYKIVINPETFEIDQAEIAKLRTSH